MLGSLALRIRSISFLLYILLIVIRWNSLWSPGYIHPDEHFQNAQQMSSFIISTWPSHVPWDWDPSSPPIRSFIGPFMTTGIPFLLYRMFLSLCIRSFQLDSSSSTWTMLWFSRLAMFIYSCFCDYILYLVAYKLRLTNAKTLVFLFASSWTTTTLLIRPFMNSFITFLYFVLFGLLSSCVINISQNPDDTVIGSVYLDFHKLRKRSVVIGWLIALGIFSHVTFLFFIFPVFLCFLGLSFLYLLSISDTRERVSFLSKSINIVVRMFAGLAIGALVFIVIDTAFYTAGSWNGLSWNHVVVTPYNNWRYNSSSAHLAEHGLHPHYLHSLVNMSLLFGPLYWHTLHSLYINYRSKSTVTVVNSRLLFFWSLVVFGSLFSLSLVPHQEPRFLLPIFMPLLFLFECLLRLTNRTHILVSTHFWTVWILFNIGCWFFFSYCHDAGLISSLSIVRNDFFHDHIRGSNPLILLCRVCMTPPYLLNFPRHVNATLLHISPSNLNQSLQTCTMASRMTYLILPGDISAHSFLAHEGWVQIGKAYPHVNLDHLDRLFQASSFWTYFCLYMFKKKDKPR
jgi:GPI mannosyltransferase 4